MRAQIITLLAGEALLLTGLWFLFWPVSLIVAGAQFVAVGAFVDWSDA